MRSASALPEEPGRPRARLLTATGAKTPRIPFDADRRPFVVAILIFAALSLAASVTSDGFLEADGCTHYLYARFAISEHHYLVNVWGRPLVTAIYALPAALGERFGVRTMSLVLAIGCALVARAIATAVGDKRPTLAGLFTLAQPLFFLHSFSELTELPFALLLATAFLCYVRRRWGPLAIFVGLSPLCRPEGFGFLALTAMALVAHRKFHWLLLLPIPLLLWDYAGWTIYGHPHYPGFINRLPENLRWLMWLPNNWPYAEKSAYLPGSLFHFVMLLPTVISPLIFPAMWIGVWRTLSPSPGIPGEGWGEGEGEGELERRWHPQICRYLTAIIPLLILLGHSLLYFTGRMASSGELRYMLVVSPFWAILAARGWLWVFERFNWRSPVRWAGLAMAMPLLANTAYPVVPLTYVTDWLQAKSLAGWIQTTPLRKDYPMLLTAHPGIPYFLNVSMTDRDHAYEWTQSVIDHAPPGAIMVWDRVYGVYNADTTRSVKVDEIRNAGWIEMPLPIQDDASHTWRVFLSPHTIAGSTTQPIVLPSYRQ